MPKVHKKIAFQKCKRCRHDRQKCLPKDRVWPGVSCDRCQKYGYECSANRSTAQEVTIGNDNPESVPANTPIRELDWSVETAVGNESPKSVAANTPLEELTSSVLHQQFHDLHWLANRTGLWWSFTDEPSAISIITKLQKGREEILRARADDRHFIDVKTLWRLDKSEQRLFACWNRVLKDNKLSEILLENWIQDCHRRRDIYEERYGFSNAVNVQYRLVQQLSSLKCQGGSDMLDAEAATLLEMCERFTNCYQSLHPALGDPVRYITIDHLFKLRISTGSNDASISVAAIRKLFTHLSDSWRTGAMAVAIMLNKSWAVEAYLDTDLDISRRMGDGMSMLYLAVSHRRTNIVHLLIEKGADTLAIKHVIGWSALHFAAFSGDEGVMRILLDSAPSSFISLADNRNETALDVARGRGKYGCIKLLQEAIARQNDVHKIQVSNRTPSSNPVPGVGYRYSNEASHEFFAY